MSGTRGWTGRAEERSASRLLDVRSEYAPSGRRSALAGMGGGVKPKELRPVVLSVWRL